MDNSGEITLKTILVPEALGCGSGRNTWKVNHHLARKQDITCLAYCILSTHHSEYLCKKCNTGQTTQCFQTSSVTQSLRCPRSPVYGTIYGESDLTEKNV